MSGRVRVGVGGWTFEPWRGVFYPSGLPHKRELEFASRALSSLEINGTYYSTFKPATWRSWREATPDDFVFAVKASRYTTNRKVLADAGPSVEKFLGQGLSELGPKLGPINWQFMATKKFDLADFSAFLDLLPKSIDGIALRHALEVRHESFKSPAFTDLARAHGAAIVYADGDDVPMIEAASSPFTYARIMTAREDLDAGLSEDELSAVARKVKAWAKQGDVFCYFISAAKVRNPAAAQALISRLGRGR